MIKELLKIIHHITVRSLLFAFFFSLIVAAAIVSVIFYNDTYVYKGKVYKGIVVNNENMSEKSLDQLDKRYQAHKKKLSAVSLTINYQDETVATFSASALNLDLSKKDFAEEPYLLGRSTNIFDTWVFKISHILLGRKTYVTVLPSYDPSVVQDHLDFLSDSYGIAPQDALFTIKNGTVTAFKIDKPGYEIEEQTALGDIQGYINSGLYLQKPNYSIQVKRTEIPAKIKIGDINSFGIKEKIAEGRSNYAGSHTERIHNLTRAGVKFNGVLIPPGEILSYNKILGEVSSNTGYVQGYII
ncbi:MAG: VanW family protein, partial [Candidatus Roizmanbacteria bacterium]